MNRTEFEEGQEQNSSCGCVLPIMVVWFNIREKFSLKSVKTVPVCTDIHRNSLPLPANSQTMEQKQALVTKKTRRIWN